MLHKLSNEHVENSWQNVQSVVQCRVEDGNVLICSSFECLKIPIKVLYHRGKRFLLLLYTIYDNRLYDIDYLSSRVVPQLDIYLFNSAQELLKYV